MAEYIYIDDMRFSLAEFLARDNSAATWVDASGCTGPRFRIRVKSGHKETCGRPAYKDGSKLSE